jgi:hypothetical protein
MQTVTTSPPTPQGPQNQYLAPQVPEQVLEVSATMVVRLLLMVMRLLLGGMAVPLEKARKSRVLLIMHGGGAAALAAAGHLVPAVYVVLSAQHPACHYTTVLDVIITRPTDGITRSLCACEITCSLCVGSYAKLCQLLSRNALKKHSFLLFMNRINPTYY